MSFLFPILKMIEFLICSLLLREICTPPPPHTHIYVCLIILNSFSFSFFFRAVLEPLLSLTPPAHSVFIVVDSLDSGYCGCNGVGEGSISGSAATHNSSIAELLLKIHTAPAPLDLASLLCTPPEQSHLQDVFRYTLRWCTNHFISTAKCEMVSFTGFLKCWAMFILVKTVYRDFMFCV